MRFITRTSRWWRGTLTAAALLAAQGCGDGAAPTDEPEASRHGATAADCTVYDPTDPTMASCTILNTVWNEDDDEFCVDVHDPCYTGEVTGSWGAGTYTKVMAFGNIDTDDALEVAIARHRTDGVRYWVLDDASTGYAPMLRGGEEALWSAGDHVTALAFGDLDADGIDELAVGRYCAACGSSGDLADARYFVLDSGEGGYAQNWSITRHGGADWGASSFVTALAFGDVDGIDEIPEDVGDPPVHDPGEELGVGRRYTDSSDARYFVMDDDGSGLVSMLDGGKTWTTSSYVTALDFGDVDGDGDDEIAVGRRGIGANPARYWIKDFDGEEQTWDILCRGGESWVRWSYPTALAFGDTLGDGMDELAVGRRYTERNDRTRWWIDKYIFNSACGSIADGGQDWPAASYVTALDLGNTDGDAYEELAIGRRYAHQGESEPRYWVKDDFWAGLADLYEGGWYWDDPDYATTLAFGDIDSDGKQELAVGRGEQYDIAPHWIRDDADASGPFDTLYSTKTDPNIEVQYLQNCYEDGDGDGHRASGAASITVASWEKTWKDGQNVLAGDRFIDCRTLGLANKSVSNRQFQSTDCDDTDPLVHPRRAENAAADGADENCDSYDHASGSKLADEAQFVYRYDLLDDDDSLYVELEVPYGHGNDLLDELVVTVDQLDGTPYAHQEITYVHEDVAGPSDPSFRVDFSADPAEKDLVSLVVDGLTAGTIYEITAELACPGGAGTCTIESDVYYAMTEGGPSNVRTKLVQRGLYEFGLNQRGLVGANAECAIGGWRYVDYETGDEWRSKYRYWCDIFAGSLYDTFLDGFDYDPWGYDGGGDEIHGPGCMDFFHDEGQMYVRGDKTDAEQAACDGTLDDAIDYDYGAPGGDWFPRGADALQPGDFLRQCSHTQMFLAYGYGYASTHKIWVLEGNSGNQVQVSEVDLDDDRIWGFGRLDTTLKGNVMAINEGTADACGLPQFNTAFLY